MMLSPHRLVQVPPGVQCFVGAEARRRRHIEETVVSVFEGWDYEEIIPPLFDYADVFGSPDLVARTYSFVGRDGSLLALRPDFTSLLAKIAAGRLAHRPAPMRLYYSGEVLRYEPPRAGAQSELFQMGLEHLGGAPTRADAEILAIAAECLDALGARGWVLAVGHVGVFHGLLAGVTLDPASMDRLRERVEAKDGSGVGAVLRETNAPAAVTEALQALGGLAGGRDVLEEAVRRFAAFPAAVAAVAELRAIVDALGEAGLGDRLAIDLGEVRGLDYYTGLVFRAYAKDLGFEVGGGGRYDTLLGRFGRPMPAVGFMLGLDRVAALLDRQQVAPPASVAPAETIAAEATGPALLEARRRRAAGARVRLDEQSQAESRRSRGDEEDGSARLPQERVSGPRSPESTR
jgi:ATP phosphoribosyltransferase regulatory subunit